MKFQEIDLTFDPIFGGIPIEIKSIFKHEFYEGKLQKRFQKLSGENYLSFTPYGDYWEFIDEWEKDLVFGENGKPIQDIIPYYEAYSKGFMDGYFEFENEIKEFSQIFFQNSFPTEKIFDEIKSTPMPFSSRGYFYPNDDYTQKEIPILSKSLLAIGGKKIGRNYKAWFYILKNPKPFIPLFRSFYFESFKFYEEEYRKWNAHDEGYISPLQIVFDEIQAKGPSQPYLTANSGKAEKQKPEEVEIQNKFNSMPIDQVRDHFKPLIEKKNPKGVIWMSIEDFKIFLRRSFGKDESLNKPKINLGNGAKMALVKLFYQLYEKCQIGDYTQNRNKEPFLNLLKEAFLTDEFNDIEASNFKASNSKYEWS